MEKCKKKVHHLHDMHSFLCSYVWICHVPFVNVEKTLVYITTSGLPPFVVNCNFAALLCIFRQQVQTFCCMWQAVEECLFNSRLAQCGRWPLRVHYQLTRYRVSHTTWHTTHHASHTMHHTPHTTHIALRFFLDY